MKLGVVTLSIGFMDFPVALRFMKEIGAQTMELSTADNVHNSTLDFSSGNRNAIKKAVNAEGLSITSLGGYTDFTINEPNFLKEQLKNVEAYCQLCGDLGVRIIRIFGGNSKENLSQDTMVRNIIDGLQEAAKVAEKYDIVMALENHGDVVNDGPTMVNIAQQVDSPSLQFTMDTGNFQWYKDHSIDQAYTYFEQVAPFVANVHLKDLVVTDDNKVKFVPLGEGVLDYGRVFSILDNAGYKGALLCEYEGLGDPRALIAEGIFTQEQFVNELKSGTERSLAYLRSVVGK